MIGVTDNYYERHRNAITEFQKKKCTSKIYGLPFYNFYERLSNIACLVFYAFGYLSINNYVYPQSVYIKRANIRTKLYAVHTLQ